MRDWPRGVIPFGGDYNPEQWPREVWREDIAAMQRAGVTFVSLGIFSWSWVEPSDGTYDFGWLDEVMGLLAAADIVFDLATAPASLRAPVTSARQFGSPARRKAPMSPMSKASLNSMIFGSGRKTPAFLPLVICAVRRLIKKSLYAPPPLANRRTGPAGVGPQLRIAPAVWKASCSTAVCRRSARGSLRSRYSGNRIRLFRYGSPLDRGVG